MTRQLWNKDGDNITLILSSVDKTEFNVVPDNIKNIYLVFPKKNKWNWTKEERWLRSIIVDDSGKVVSCGWPKFGNYGEFLDDTEILNKELYGNKDVYFSLKEDGTLCIRSVINGEVVLRTRGTICGIPASSQKDFKNEYFGEIFKKVASNKYPKLLDPTWALNKSLLFEYVSPNNRIVVYNPIEDLIFLGGVSHNLNILKWNEILTLSKQANLRIVELKTLPRDPIKLLEEIKVWKDEGVVARCQNEQIFVKVKSAYYLANHRMKSSMDYLCIVEFIEGGNIQSEEQFVEDLKNCNYDWEIIQSAKEFYNRYQAAKNLAENSLKTATEIIISFNEKWMPLPGKINWQHKMETERLKRKDLAMLLKSHSRIVQSFGFCVFDGKQDRIHNLFRKVILTEGK